jgi:molybdate transport system ATP-binding protein
VTTSLAEVLDVRVQYRVHPALSLDVSLRLGREIGVVFGRSGAGKTTLLRLIAGLATPKAGRVQLEGTVLFDSQMRVALPLRHRRIGMIFQDDCLFPHLKVAANICFGLKGLQPREAKGRLAEVAALCGVEHLLERGPETLSGGERQRVGLARALAPRPRLLLCDEPVSALDLPNRHALLERIRAVQRTEGIPMLYVTHSPAEAIALGSRLFLLEEGRIAAEGPPLDVLAAARTGAAAPSPWEDVRNIFPACIVGETSDQRASRVKLDNGPELIVPLLDYTPGERVVVEIRAEDILVARQPICGLSARNQVVGTVERIIPNGPDAEAIVRTDGITWIVSLMSPAVDQLELGPGIPVQLVVKARSCHVIRHQF